MLLFLLAGEMRSWFKWMCLSFVFWKIREVKIEESLGIVRKNKFEWIRDIYRREEKFFVNKELQKSPARKVGRVDFAISFWQIIPQQLVLQGWWWFCKKICRKSPLPPKGYKFKREIWNHVPYPTCVGSTRALARAPAATRHAVGVPCLGTCQGRLATSRAFRS